jgi:hypothetical protein
MATAFDDECPPAFDVDAAHQPEARCPVGSKDIVAVADEQS